MLKFSIPQRYCKINAINKNKRDERMREKESSHLGLIPSTDMNLSCNQKCAIP